MSATNAQLLQQESQSLNPSSVIHLFTLDASNVGGAIHRFSMERETDGTPVSFGGNQFPQLSVQVEGFEWNSDGTLPRPKMSASALNDTFYSLIVLTNGAQGALLLRERTLAKFLDGHEYGGRGIKFSSDLYIVDRVTTLTKSLVTLELITPLDLPRCELPARVALRDMCPWVYRYRSGNSWVYDQTGNACPYTGNACYDKFGQSCDPADDACGHTLSDCVRRFGTRKALPYGGFPGLARTRS